MMAGITALGEIRMDGRQRGMTLMAGDQKTVTTIIKIKLKTARRTRAMLADVAYQCNLARNLMVRHWLRWREDNPDYQPGDWTPTRGKNKGVSRREPEWASYAEQVAMREAARAKSPQLAGIIVSGMLHQEVCDYLTGKVPYDHVGKARWRWQAIIGNEIQAPTHRGAHIPVHNNSSVFAWGRADGVDCSRELSPGIMAKIRKAAQSQCLLYVPLFSKESGRGTGRAFVLRIGKQSEGRKRILRRLAIGKYKMGDSEIVEKDGEWYLHLCYQHPVADNNLDVDRAAVLRLAGATDRHPFVIEAMDDGQRWLFEGPRYRHAIQHLRSRRDGIKHQHRGDQGGHKGHGRKRFYADVRPVSRACENVQKLFRAKLISAIVKHCCRHACGTLIYHEPTPREKAGSWFAKNDGLEFGWELFLSDLKHKCKLEGIEYASGEGDDEKPGTARDPQDVGSNGSVPTTAGSGRGAKPKKANRSRGSAKGKRSPGDRMPSVARHS